MFQSDAISCTLTPLISLTIMEEEIKALMADKSRPVIINYFHIGTINTQTLSLTDLPKQQNISRWISDDPSEDSSDILTEKVNDCRTDISIPPKLKPIYDRLDAHMQLVCYALVLLQDVTDGGVPLFHFANDWWATYSPLVYDELLPKNPADFYRVMEALGMGLFKISCTRDRMLKINGVFLKDYRTWTLDQFYDGYGQRSWMFWHKKKIADTLAEILKHLHKEMGI